MEQPRMNEQDETVIQKEAKDQATEPVEASTEEKLLPEEEPSKEVVALQEALAALQKKFDELNDAHLRLMAEFDNYRKRTLREKAEMIKSAGESVLVNLLPLIDDLERGVKSAEETTDITAVKEGLTLIYSKFLNFLKQNGVTPIDTANHCDFDTAFHEAITTIPAPSEELKGKIIDSVQKGYMLRDKVIRFAKVIVGE
ncbi:MAG: nucleotide exchange factor GrpE [Microbacter sp.]